MKHEIIRHQLKNFHILEDEVDYFHTKIEMHLGRMLTGPENIANRMFITLEIVNMAIVINRSKDDVIELMRLALSLGIANYESLISEKNKHGVDYRGKTFPVGYKKRTHYVGAFTWSKVFSLAVILRDHEAIKFLVKIQEELLITDDIALDAVDYSRVRFLKGIYDDTADIGALLLQVYEDADMNKLDAERGQYINEDLIPEISVYRCVFSNLQDELTEKLAEALELHKKKWGTAENAMDARGWLSLNLLAAAVIAKGGKGMSIEVESDYIPKWIVDGDF